MRPPGDPANWPNYWEKNDMNGYFGNAGIFLVQVVLGIYILMVMLRFLFQLVRADFYNPISQAILKITNPPIKPLRRIIPGLWGLDLASLLLMVVLQTFELWAITAMRVGSLFVPPLGLIVLAGAQLVQLTVYVFLFSLIVQIIISWINPQGAHGNPAFTLMHNLTEPLLRPARRILPPMGGLDLSPIAVIIGLQLILFLVVAPLKDLARSLF